MMLFQYMTLIAIYGSPLYDNSHLFTKAQLWLCRECIYKLTTCFSLLRVFSKWNLWWHFNIDVCKIVMLHHFLLWFLYKTLLVHFDLNKSLFQWTMYSCCINVYGVHLLHYWPDIYYPLVPDNITGPFWYKRYVIMLRVDNKVERVYNFKSSDYFWQI